MDTVGFPEDSQAIFNGRQLILIQFLKFCNNHLYLPNSIRNDRISESIQLKENDN